MSTVISGMSYNPDFTRVAGQWSEAWLAQKGQQLDGVIALDPILLQYVMDALDISVTMSQRCRARRQQRGHRPHARLVHEHAL